MRILFLSMTILAASLTQAADRPSVVWIVSEDNSHHYLRHFFPGGAEAPNIEALAAEGLTFNHAFSNAPVCSVARTTLATACDAPRIGTQFHRKYQAVPLPEGIQMFPAYLREAGYYTTNNAKTDYNAILTENVWDESSRRASWRNRPDNTQPFFHMQSFGQSHEGSLHFNRQTFENVETTTDPEKIRLADYHPDTPLFRYTHARYLDRMKIIDQIVGDVVSKLRDDGLLEDTFVFYFGDHGGVLPRGKGYIYESGLHVPLVIRIPENFRHLVDAEPASRVNGFVSFVDFGPTVLRLAGVNVPSGVDGRPFLGPGVVTKEVDARDETFGYADRFDEKYDLVRSIRKGKYQYVRNYQPYLPDGLQNNYRYKMLAYQQWRELFEEGALEGAPLNFFQPKTVEALYDVEKDPHEVHNLAGDPAHAADLKELRGLLQAKVKSLPDLSFYPESHLVANAFDDPAGFGQEHQQDIATLVDTADLALAPFGDAKLRLQEALKGEQPLVRYWAAIACSSFGNVAAELVEDVRPLLDDVEPIVRVRAAEFLGLVGAINPQPTLAAVVNETDDPVLATEALNSVVWFRDFFQGRFPVSRADYHPKCQGADMDDRLNYINGTPYPPRARRGQNRRRARAAGP